jgi:hypothetical protein
LVCLASSLLEGAFLGNFRDAEFLKRPRRAAD